LTIAVNGLIYVHIFVVKFVIILVQESRVEKGCDMLRTTNVSKLRSDLSSFLKELDKGPVLFLSHSRPKAVLIDPEMFDALVEKIELLEDLVDGRRAIAEYRADPDLALDAEDIFERLGH